VPKHRKTTLDIGTNDLTGPKDAVDLALSVLEVARALLAQGVKRVVIFGALDRTESGKFGAPRTFNIRARAFNKAIQQRLRLKTWPIYFWYHKGLSAQATKFIADGVHLNSEGVQKYIQSIRRAIMKFTRDMVGQ